MYSVLLEFLTRHQIELVGKNVGKAEKSGYESFNKVSILGSISKALIQVNGIFLHTGKWRPLKSNSRNIIH